MELARVVGQCTATVKEASLDGRKLALTRRMSEDGRVIGEVEVALDVTGAGPGQTVVVTRGSAARQPSDNRQLAVDLSIVAIVDAVTVDPAGSSTSTPTHKPAATRKSRPRTGGKSNG